MRLIDVKTLKFVTFSDERDLPKYAILSHRWHEGQEVLYKDLLKNRNLELLGWEKVRFCCEQAIKDDLPYAWIDTCCIDKNSSAELSEAINSMYRWYESSTLCYAYLQDVATDETGEWMEEFVKSSWFTRSWTLQELLAPKVVAFYGAKGQHLGSRRTLCEEIAEATDIHLSLLSADEINLADWSIAQRMSWASRRNATRVEDIAYSLLGLFNVNMPLLYGEGSNAFQRLQQEIIRQSSDQTIFAWSIGEPEKICSISLADRKYEGIQGLLAPAPKYFDQASNVTVKLFQSPRPFTMTNLGLSIEWHIERWIPGCYWAGLNCTTNTQDQLGIWLFQDPEHHDLFSRITLTMPYTSGEIEQAQTGQDLPSYSSHIMARPISTLRCQSKSIYLSLATDHQQLGLPVSLEKLPGIFFHHFLKSYEGSRSRATTHYKYMMSRSEVSAQAECFPRFIDSSGLFLCMSAGKLAPPGVMQALDLSAGSTCLSLGKVGFDQDFLPFLILQQRPRHEFCRPGRLSTAVSLHSLSFWECSGLESHGWLKPGSSIVEHPEGMQRGLWGLKTEGAPVSIFRLSVTRPDGLKFIIEVIFRRSGIGPRHYELQISEKDNNQEEARKKTRLYTQSLDAGAAQNSAELDIGGIAIRPPALSLGSLSSALRHSADRPWSSWLHQHYDHELPQYEPES